MWPQVMCVRPALHHYMHGRETFVSMSDLSRALMQLYGLTKGTPVATFVHLWRTRPVSECAYKRTMSMVSSKCLPPTHDALAHLDPYLDP